MLTRKGFHQNFRIISFGCKVGILPLEVDVEKGKLGLLNSKWKKGICWVYFGSYVLHAAYIALRFPYVLATMENIPLIPLAWHIVHCTPKHCVLTIYDGLSMARYHRHLLQQGIRNVGM